VVEEEEAGQEVGGAGGGVITEYMLCTLLKAEPLL
jgi:hypothetical protein